VVLILTGPACRQDMFNQPKVKPLARSDFFEDGMSARPPIDGTVARGELRADRVFYTGIGPDGTFVPALPVPLTRALLLRGRERFDIFCSPCHSRVGDGRGMIVERGFKEPPSFHIDRLRAQPIGYFFDVMTSGFGQMSDYAAQVPASDRWAIAAYIRALQLSQHAPLSDVPARDRRAIETLRSGPPGAAGAGAPAEETRR
jgi:cbb3-type cytochrome c oxidase subunit III